MWIERPIAAELRSLAATRPAVLVTGARQTGKTSLLTRTFPEAHLVSLDLPGEAELAEREPETFFRRHPPPVIIDEVQYAPGLFRHLKAMIDRDRSAMGRFLLMGSQKHQLMEKSAESLAGRIGLLELETLSHAEMAGARAPLDLDQEIVQGGYPELAANPNARRSAFYASYVATYLERDVRTLLNVSSLRDFERFIRCCALRSGQILNKAELARDVGINPTTANHWISVLHASNLVTLLEPWFSNRTKSVVKSPKLYVNDTGLLCYLMDIRNPADLTASPLRGSVWESFVFSEIRKQQTLRLGHWSCWFWADYQHELDFLIHRGGLFELYEAKATTRPDMSDARQLNYVTAKLGRDLVRRRGIICRVPHSYPMAERIEAMTIDSIAPAEEDTSRIANPPADVT